MSGKTFKNPLNQDERNMMLELSSLTAKHKLLIHTKEDLFILLVNIQIYINFYWKRSLD